MANHSKEEGVTKEEGVKRRRGQVLKYNKRYVILAT